MSEQLRTYKRLGLLTRNLTAELRAEYGRILVDTSNLVKSELLNGTADSLEEFVLTVNTRMGDDGYADICLAMASGADFRPLVWEKVQDHLCEVLDEIFPYEDTPEPDYEETLP